MKLNNIVQTEYETIENKEIKMPKKEKIMALEEIYLSWLEKISSSEYDEDTQDQYDDAVYAIAQNDLSYSAEEITEFCMLLPLYEKKPCWTVSGKFLSALINTHYWKENGEGEHILEYDEQGQRREDELDYLIKRLKGLNETIEKDTLNKITENEIKNEIKNEINKEINKEIEKEETASKKTQYLLIFSHLETPLDFLCTKNEANIRIIGNVGSFLGDEMKSGNVLVEGNAEDYVGCFMQGGELSVQKAGEYICENMTGGIVGANEIERVSYFLHKGELHIEQGDLIKMLGYGVFSPKNKSFSVYYAGKQVLDEKSLPEEEK